MIPALAKGLFAVWLCWLALPAHAATVAGLYEAEVPVTGRDVDQRNQAIGQALAQVLVRLTGRDPAPGGEALISQAPSYVQQYRYLSSVSPEGAPSSRLWVRFDKVGLDRALRQRGLPLWGEKRPGVLVWLGAEQGGRRQLMASDSAPARAMSAAARARGLPLQWPLLDLEDQARLTTADLWSDYAAAVKQASARYAEPLVLTGRLRQVATDHWEGRWTLYHGEDARGLRTAGPDAAQAAAAVVAQVTDQLAARYAPAGGNGGPTAVRLRIEGVRDVAAYARVVKLVGDLELVDRVLLRSAAGDALVLDVLARGGRDALAQVLDLARGLRREPDPLPPAPAYMPPAPQPVGPPGAPVTDGGGAVPTQPATEQPQPDTRPAPVVGPSQPVPAPAPPPVDLVYRLTL